jgi:hypothetical protein
MGHDPLHEMGRLARSRKVFLWILSASVGALLGYLLFNPLFSLPPEWVVSRLKPVLLFASQQIDNHELEHILLLVSIEAILNLPNTVLISIVAALSIFWLQRKRLILYAALLWPIGLYLGYWVTAVLFKSGMVRLGLMPETERLPFSPGFPYMAALVFVTVTTFLLVSLMLERLFRRVVRNRKFVKNLQEKVD